MNSLAMTMFLYYKMTDSQIIGLKAKHKSGFVVSRSRLSKICSVYFQRLFKDLREQSAVEKLRA
jgi:hypothetical protein